MSDPERGRREWVALVAQIAATLDGYHNMEPTKATPMRVDEAIAILREADRRYDEGAAQ